MDRGPLLKKSGASIFRSRGCRVGVTPTSLHCHDTAFQQWAKKSTKGPNNGGGRCHLLGRRVASDLRKRASVLPALGFLDRRGEIKSIQPDVATVE